MEFRLVLSLVIFFFAFHGRADRFMIPPFDESLLSYPSLEVLPQLPSEFSMLVWNVHKGKDEEAWVVDMNRLTGRADMFVLQEALDDDQMNQLFKQDLHQYEWYFAKSFSYTKTGISSGVVTGSKFEAWARLLHRTEDREPFVKTPKTVVIAFYQLTNGKNLAVLNIHGLNKTSNEAFFKQIDESLVILKNHEGPVVYAGDFNTNNKSKTEGLNQRLAKIGLKKIGYETDHRKHKLDWIYIRGCTPTESEILYDIKTSDHTPLYAKLKCD
jgi:endonuclease/exonuclease/phosphatase (EEP) superfamily protein YafD